MADWIFLRGLIREAGHWLQFPRQFKHAFPQDRVHFFEIPGTGQHFQADSPTEIGAMVEALQTDFAKRLPNLSEKPLILSISLGSMVTLEWLSRYPQQFGGAVLINTSLSSLNPVYERLQPHNYPWILKLLATPSPEVRERQLLKLVSNEPQHHILAASKFAAIQHLRPVSRANALRQLYAASRYHLKDKPTGVPLLLLNSEGDRFVNPVCTEALAKYLDVPWQTHPHAGHDLPLDAPEWVLERIQAWRQHL
ncbi:MAG: alpha/beta fold hydrolase [Candidatus Sericytochromatia bacterium]